MTDQAAKPLVADDYENLVTALGTGKDKSRSTRFGPDHDLDVTELDELYEHEPLAARIVDRVVDDGTREGWSVVGNDPSFNYAELTEGFDAIRVDEAVADGWRWARLYGGAIIIMVVNDNRPMNEQIDLSRANRILALHVIESPFATPRDFRPGLGSSAFRNPEAYDVLAPGGSLSRSIHSSRVIRIEGIRVPPTRIVARGGWPPSVLDRVWTDLKRLGSVMGYGENIMHELSVMVLKMTGFRTAAAGSGKSKAELQKAVETMRMFIDQLHTLVIDAGDEYVESTRSVSGLDALMGRFVDGLVRVTDMPRTILLGEQPGGLNANADSEIRAWFDFVSSQQRLILQPILNRIVGLELLLREKRGGPVPLDWSIEFASLWQPTEKEQADTAAVLATAAATLVSAEIASPDEMRAKFVSEGKLDPLPSLTAEDPAGAQAAGGAASVAPIEFAPTDITSFVNVNQALASIKLPPWPIAEEGLMTVAQFRKLKETEAGAVGEAEGAAAAEALLGAIAAPEDPELGS